jgi:hypothetical protein
VGRCRVSPAKDTKRRLALAEANISARESLDFQVATGKAITVELPREEAADYSYEMTAAWQASADGITAMRECVRNADAMIVAVNFYTAGESLNGAEWYAIAIECPNSLAWRANYAALKVAVRAAIERKDRAA